VGGLVYQPFDLLYLDGRLLLNVKLEDRKRLLRSVLRDHPRVRFAAHVEAEGKAFYEAARLNGLEGIIAKLRRSRYEPGRRSNAWLKLKVRPEQELVIGGWTPGEGNARDLGALAVGYYDDGKLRFAGKVGPGSRAPCARTCSRSCSRWSSRILLRSAAAQGLQGPLGWRSRCRDLGPAGARHARRARWLDARRRRWQAAYKGIESGRDARTSGARTRRNDERGPRPSRGRRGPTSHHATAEQARKRGPAEDDEHKQDEAAIEENRTADRQGFEAPHDGQGRGSRGPRGVACQRRGAGDPRCARQGGLVAGR
jgi:hypothetical protein